MNETETRADRLAAITEQNVMDLMQGANFIVVCPQCEVEWAMGVSPFTLAAARNTYGSTAVDNRFARLEADPPEVRCGTCTFRGDS